MYSLLHQRLNGATRMSRAAIEVHSLTVAYGQKPVLWDVDVSIPSGKLVAIVGPNGAGKSTLLKAILGLISATNGFVKALDQDVSEVRKQIGYVPQRETVDWDFPVSVLDVVEMGRYGRIGWLKRPSKRDRDIALSSLEQVGMLSFAKRQISQLSGGQQQRVFLARALAQEPEIYLMDEPFAGVDAATERAMIEILRTLRSNGKTIIAVHHDLQTISEYFDWVAMLNLHLVAAGPISEAYTPENLQKTYGGRLTILDQVAEAIRTGQQRSVQDTKTGVT
jgi:manganese/zinc/iron transport system ATP- binding protein